LQGTRVPVPMAPHGPSHGPYSFCSLRSFWQTRGAVQNVVSISKDTGTAVTTIKDCSALILDSPMTISTNDTSPIRNAQKTRNDLDGSPLPVMAIEIVSDIESVVVKTKIIVVNRSRNPIIVPNGNCSAMAIIAAGGPALLNASDIEPGFCISSKIPVPPTIVNQNVVTTGAITATAVTISRIVRPREMRLTNMAIIGA